jgi:hypothetical protein
MLEYVAGFHEELFKYVGDGGFALNVKQYEKAYCFDIIFN